MADVKCRVKRASGLSCSLLCAVLVRLQSVLSSLPVSVKACHPLPAFSLWLQSGTVVTQETLRMWSVWGRRGRRGSCWGEEGVSGWWWRVHCFRPRAAALLCWYFCCVAIQCAKRTTKIWLWRSAFFCATACFCNVHELCVSIDAQRKEEASLWGGGVWCELHISLSQQHKTWT